jgi:hypothetical protein
MLRAMCSRRALVVVFLIVTAMGLCRAEIVNINPHKIILNAQGLSDDVQANVRIILPGARVVDYDVTLSFNGTVVAEAESAFYCVIDDILIVGFDRTSLQDNPDVIALANSTVEATVTGSVTVINAEGVETEVSFSGSDMVEIVAPGKKGC